MVMLNRYDYIPMRSPPTAKTAKVSHIRSQSVTKNNHFPFLIRLRIINIQRCITKHRHFYFSEKRHDELEEPKWQSVLGRVNKSNLIQRPSVLLRRNPLAMLSIWHRWIKYTYLNIFDFVSSISGIVGPFSNYFNVVKFKINHKKT